MATAAFLSGMLHDIGKLILAVNFSDAYRDLLQKLPETASDRLTQEAEMIGTTHAEIGAYLMGLWGLEPPILAAIAFHHCPQDSQVQAVGPITAVHLANGFEHGLRQSNYNGGEPGEDFDAAYLDSLDITGEVETWRQACADLEGESL